MRTATFPGKLENLSKISRFVVQAAEEAGLDDTAVYAVELAVDEACTNIIEHAYGGENKGDIVCSCGLTEEGFKIVLHDHGSPFDPAKVREPKKNARLKDLPVRGAGIFLMRKMMDHVRFEFKEGDGNFLTMIKRKD